MLSLFIIILGPDTLKELGGLHKFMNWNRHVIVYYFILH